MYTIKDIAKFSGYGISTVSRALNGHPDVSEEARKKIRAIADQYGFVPNANARQLKLSVNKAIAIIVKGTFNVFFSGLIENMQTEIDRGGYTVMLHYIDTEQNEVETAKLLCTVEKPCGIIFLGGNTENFNSNFKKHIKIPCVLCTTSGENISAENLGSVSVDDIDGGRQAIDYLISCGHRKIGIIGGDIKNFCTTGQRYVGCINSFKEHKCHFDDTMYEEAGFTFDSAYRATNALLKRHNDFTAIFAMSDTMAIGAIRAISDMGYKVPDNISVLGFDGIDMAAYYNPIITTFKQPELKIASITVKQLKTMITEPAKPEHILLKAKFQDGGSVKKI